MEKVICTECGSIGYTASPELVPCDICGGRHKIIAENYTGFKRSKRIGLLSLLGLVKG